MSIGRRAFCLAVATCIAAAGQARADGTRFWQEGEALLMKRGEARVGVGWKLSSADSSARLDGWEVKPRLQRAVLPWLEVAATYKFVRAAAAGRSWDTTHGLELDVTQHWGQSAQGTARFTQRLGVTRPPAAEVRYRYHAIPKIEWPARWLPARVAADSSLEAIYDIRQSTWVETKLTPLRLRFPVGSGCSWSVAYLLNHKRGGSVAPWHRDHVIVVGIAFDLRNSSASR